MALLLNGSGNCRLKVAAASLYEVFDVGFNLSQNPRAWVRVIEVFDVGFNLSQNPRAWVTPKIFNW